MASTPASASPGPSSGPTFLEQHNQFSAPKPFKLVDTFSTSSTGRKRNLKQIIAFEQEAQFELAGIATSGRGRGRKVAKSQAAAKNSGATPAGGGTGASTPTGTGGGKAGGGTKQLIGAAAKAVKRRDDRLKREAAAAAAAAAAAGEGGAEGAAEGTPAPAAAAAGGDGDEAMGDASMVAEAEATPAVDEKSEEQKAAEEKERQRKMALPTYLNIEAPPSLRPAKKYCDVTGLLAPYTDPKTGLRYHSAEIYEVLKTFGPGVDQAYLGLRGRHSTLM